MFPKRLLAILGLFYFFPAISQPLSPSLMPLPAAVKLGPDKFRIDTSFRISGSADNADEMSYTAINQFYHTLMRRSGVIMKEKRIVTSRAAYSLSVKVKKSAPFFIGVDESYFLSVQPNIIQLETNTSVGVLRGLATLQQLLQRDSLGFYFPVAEIKDSPRFEWRGLMIDVSRHFIPLDVLRRNIDAMCAVKMNVLHLHLTDDEGFRIESKQFPKLHQLGSDGLFYTQQEMKELIRYASLRGIMIVPEFDMPGHTRSWFAGYPVLASAPGPYRPGPRFDVGLTDGGNINIAAIMSAPTPTIDPTRETTYQFLEKFFKEMADLFPAPYVHIGADENNGAAWKNNKEIAAFMSSRNYKTPSDLQAYFVERLYAIVTKNKKQLIGWEELFHKGIPKDIIVQKWIAESPLIKGHGSPEEISSAGNAVLLSQGFYLDLFMPAYIHYQNPAVPTDAKPLNKFLGGEAAIWTEIADRYNIERRVWPRAAAVAERLWSPETVNDVNDMYSRLFAVSRQLDEAGLEHESSYTRAMKRLANGDEWMTLMSLVDVLHPARGYKNIFGRLKNPEVLLNNQAPLVKVADWVASDSETRLRFRKSVDEFLKERSVAKAAVLKERLNKWSVIDDALQSAGINQSSYREIGPHSRNLKAISLVGILAVDYILAGKSYDEAELTDIRQKLKDAAAEHGTTFLAIVPEIESLVNQKLTPEPKQFPLF